MDIDTARRLFIHLAPARTALSNALVETIKADQREAGERIMEAVARVEEVMDECIRIAPTLHYAPQNDWPEREDPP